MAASLESRRDLPADRSVMISIPRSDSPSISYLAGWSVGDTGGGDDAGVVEVVASSRECTMLRMRCALARLRADAFISQSSNGLIHVVSWGSLLLGITQRSFTSGWNFTDCFLVDDDDNLGLLYWRNDNGFFSVWGMIVSTDTFRLLAMLLLNILGLGVMFMHMGFGWRLTIDLCCCIVVAWAR